MVSGRRLVVFGVVAAVAALVVVPPGVASAGLGVRTAVSQSGARILTAWGDNRNGVLGPDRDTSYPGQVPGLPGTVVSVSSNNATSVAALADGSVWAWGQASCGLRGDGILLGGEPVPARVPGLPSTIVQVSISWTNALALSSDGSVYSWGCNDEGQLGTGAVGPPRAVPGRVTLAGVSGVAEVAAGYDFSMVLFRSGEVYGWGENLAGQLGNGSQVGSLTPVRADAPHGIAHIAVGNGNVRTVIAVRDLKFGGGVYTWGSNESGALGRDTPGHQYSATPMQVGAGVLANVTQVATGGFTDLAVRSDGTVWGWGSNVDGDLARTDAPPVGTVVQLAGLTNITQVAIGLPGGPAVAVRADGTVWRWGSTSHGTRGDGTVAGTSRTLPIVVSRVHGAAKVAVGWFNIFVVAASVDPSPARVPNVLHLDRSSAIRDIQAAGLVVGNVTEMTVFDEDDNVVLSQSPEEGTLVDAGTAVNLVISRFRPRL